MGEVRDHEKNVNLAWSNYDVPRHESTLSASNGGNLIELVIAGLGLRRAKKIATKHYKKNEAAYQVQAVKDAHDEGVDTNFGTEDRPSEQKTA